MIDLLDSFRQFEDLLGPFRVSRAVEKQPACFYT